MTRLKYCFCCCLQVNYKTQPEAGPSRPVEERLPQQGSSRASEESEPQPGLSRTVEESEPQPGPSRSAEDREPGCSNELEGEVEGKFSIVETAFKCRLQTYRIKDICKGDLKTVFNTYVGDIQELLELALKRYNCIKCNILVECIFENVGGEKCLKNFKSKNQALYRESNVENGLREHMSKIITEMDDSVLKGSGWHFLTVEKLEIRINKCPALSRGSQYVRLPEKYRYSRSIVNIQNLDDYCFKYCVLAKFIEKDKDLWINYQNQPHLDSRYDWSCIEYPVALKDISKFEKRNNISINVYGIEKEKESNDCEIFPLKVCDEELEDHRDLLYITDNDRSHYCCILNLNALVSSQITKHTYSGTLKVCKRCFAHYSGENAEEKLMEHKMLCGNFDAVKCVFPKKDKINFENHGHAKKLRFAIYADFECMLKPIEGCKGDPSSSWTYAYESHIPYSYSYFIKDNENEYSHLRLYRGANAGEHFMSAVVKDIHEIGKILYESRKPMLPMTQNEVIEFKNSNTCHICKKGNFTKENFKVRDHCHVTGKYRGPAHSKCNLMYRDQNFVPVVLHNMSSYDAHLLVKCLGYDDNKIDVIAKSEEKYITFTKYVPIARNNKEMMMKLRFIDSYSFLNGSLGKLADTLPPTKFSETRNYFGNHAGLMCKKGVFPYAYITDMDVLEESELPPKSKFFNRLTNSDISDAEYDHAKTVWENLNVKSLGEYSDIYLKTDVLILTDIFENFREMCMHTYDLDPLYYFTIPGLAYSAMLKYTGIELDIIKDIDILMTIERGIRGGICQCVTRYAEANESNSLYYIDANNLYGWAMSQYLPYGNFRWLSEDEIQNLNVLSLDDNCEKGYILEVDLEYPIELHDDHKDLPYCCENKCAPSSKNSKLLTTLDNKNNYVIHYRNLKQALQGGLHLKKIHRVIEFDQSDWLKQYIDLNAEKRKVASNEFEKNFFKLMVNAVFGKTMENVRKRMQFELVSNKNRLNKLIKKSTFVDRIIYGENIVGMHFQKTKIVLDRAMYVGMCILDISKLHMYNFHYNVIKPLFHTNIELCYMDTDSFIYLIKCKDVQNYLQQIAVHLDTSNYCTKNKLHSLSNQGVLGKFKDEVKGKTITRFVGLRAKMYAIEVDGESEIKKLKGITRAVLNKDVCFDDYVTCLNEGKTTYSENHLIRSVKHNVYTMCMNKRTLDSGDDKRVILADGIHTVPHGYKRLKQN